MKYIFITGAPGSKWSSVAKNIYYSPSIDQSDSSELRTYYRENLTHFGSYFDPGMEFSLPDDLSTMTKAEAEQLFDKPFNGIGVRMIKSHTLSNNIAHLKEIWHDCPIIMVHRDNDKCLAWWKQAGGFDITYPNYRSYYQNFTIMQEKIIEQNQNIIKASNDYYARVPLNNLMLCEMIDLRLPTTEYYQDYTDTDIKVIVI